jgi:predicted Zn-dependent protease
LTATEQRRRDPVLAGAPLLVGFAFMMGIVMTVVFPTGREYAEVTDKQGVNAFSIAYLTVLTRADPSDLHLRLVYVKQLSSLGRWDDALDALARAPEAARRTPELRVLRLELVLAKARGLPEDAEERAAAFRDVHTELGSLVETAGIPTNRTRELADLALELEDPILAARYFLLAAETGDAETRAAALAEAGRWYRAGGDGERGADCWQKAAEKTADAAKKREYLLEAAGALEGTRGACAAADVVFAPAKVDDDVAFVRRATDLLRSCARATDAKILGRRLLSLVPDNEPEMRLQVRRELEAGDPRGALVVLQRLVAKHPGDTILHEATARVAEWAGDPQAALRHWLWLLDSGRIPSDRIVLP